MKKALLFLLFCLPVIPAGAADAWIRINQMGYLPADSKVAVWISHEAADIKNFSVKDAVSDKTVLVSNLVASTGEYGGTFKNTYRLNFSAVEKEGSYYIEANGVKSPSFRIGADVYDGTADFILQYMRQQRCGYNPFTGDSCHTHDGYIIYHPTRINEKIDAVGGWHDASDYLQYVTTTANTVYQMLFAYQKNPGIYGDRYDANGHDGPNGIPDILDEAKWGLDWLYKMNPDDELMFNQLADDRDHVGYKLPANDKVDYGWGPGQGRPVYFVTGEPQGFGKHKNKSTGVASTAGKFASVFSLGANTLGQYYPEFAEKIKGRVKNAYQWGLDRPGVCQTACGASPYFYEEDNYTDDMQLAAVEMYRQTGDRKYIGDAVLYGRMEPVTPWMGADSARHYQWYPFVNLGHYYLAADNNLQVSKEFIRNMKSGLDRIYDRAKGTAFLNGVPFVWCSNNLTVGAITQARLYAELTGDTSYKEMETSLRDWLFGCNPWGSSMIIGLPEWGDYPAKTHSVFPAVYGRQIPGGLVDGPVYARIFNSLAGVHLRNGDVYEKFQNNISVYHDDDADYSTNEPTMDGTASLSYMLSSLEAEGRAFKKKVAAVQDHNTWQYDGIVRGDKSKKQLTLAFTAHEFVDGYPVIRQVLKKHGIQGAFFFTGDCYRWHPEVAKGLKADGHYLGAHSDKHLLYNDWGKRDSLLVTYAEFEKDLKDNYAEMQKFGIEPQDAPFYMPPYEHYNAAVSAWCKNLGIQVVNYSPGTSSNADYTTPDMKNYLSSEQIMQRIMDYEAKESLNGFLMLIHTGTHPDRTDKLYDHLDELIVSLKKKGYRFVPIRENLGFTRQ